ncbi:MAG: HEAT repeat domain-containing protein [Candidatus Micrarchaeota archaeon]
MVFNKPTEFELEGLPIKSRRLARIIYSDGDSPEKRGAFWTIGDYNGIPAGLYPHTLNIAKNSPSEFDRMLAACALAEDHSPQVIEIIRSDKSPMVRAAAAVSLSEYGASEYCTKNLFDLYPAEKNEEVKAAYIETIASAGYADYAFEPLLKASRDESELVRAQAGIGLANNSKGKSIAEKMFKTDKSAFVRVAVAEELKAMDDELVSDANRIMKTAKNKKMQEIAFYAMSSIRSEQAKQGLLDALRSNNNVIRWMAIDRISYWNTEEVFDEIEKLTEDDYWVARSNAWDALGRMNLDKAIPIVLKKLHEEKESSVWSTMVKLVGRKDKSLFHELIVSELEGKRPEFKNSAVWVLCLEEREKALPILEKFFVDGHLDDVLRMLPYPVGLAKSSKSVELIGRIINKSDEPEIKLACIDALIQIGSYGAYDVVKTLIKDKNLEVREMAMRSADNIQNWSRSDPISKHANKATNSIIDKLSSFARKLFR